MRSRLLVAFPLAVHAGMANAAFDPPDGKVYRYLTVETRSDGAVSRSFSAERELVFRRSADGFDAELTLVRVDQSAGADVGAMFESALGALKGRTIRFRLAADGTVAAIEDQAAIWSTIVAAIAHMAPGGADAYATPMATLSAGQQAAMIASMIAPVIAGKDADVAIGTRPVTVPGDSPIGTPCDLAGQEARSRDPDGTIYIALDAAGDTPVPAQGDVLDAPDPLGETAHVSLHARKRVDPATGLVLENRETSETAIGEGAGARHSSTVTVTTLVLKVS